MDDFAQRMQAYKTCVEEGINRILPGVDTPPSRIHEAMCYSLAAGGKRLRPVLVLAAADLYPQRIDPVPAAVAVECLHTYSLIHDDLPSMDDSPLRRGQPASHIQFDEATAILAGDALLTEAFAILARHYADHPVTALGLIRLLSVAADSRHLIGGQVVDTLSENQRIEAETLEYIHTHKTADLLTAALRMGLEVTEAPAESLPLVDKIGHCLGLAFQIVDDLLDTTASTEQLGKSVGHDARQAKATYVALHGAESSRSRVDELTSAALEACRQLPATDASFLQELIQRLQFRLN
jgi:geranylgeranyl diphosphate synthase type II